MKNKIEKKRWEAQWPVDLLKEIDEYATANYHTTRISAVIELIRAGLEAKKKELKGEGER
jgi:metal-responsive CopG/Arc/MetJ family transcriptional regulator